MRHLGRMRDGTRVSLAIGLLAVLSGVCFGDIAKGSHMHIGSPLFNLALDVDGCSYIAFVNGGLISMNLEGGGTHEQQPINHWLRSGQNELTVQVFRWSDNDGKDDACVVKAVVTVADNDGPNVPGKTAMTLAYSATAAAAGAPTRDSSPPGRFDSEYGFRSSRAGDVEVGPATSRQLSGKASKVQELSRTFSVDLPFPVWAFFKGDKLKQWWEYNDDKEVDPIYGQIEAAYKALYEMLLKKDVGAFLDACEERSREIDIAYFKRKGETREQLKKHLESAIGDRKLALYDFVWKPGRGRMRYTVGPTGQVIGLTLGRQAAPILRFEMKDDTPFSMIFPVFFRRDGNRYIVTR
jgi:hypothetical protein